MHEDFIIIDGKTIATQELRTKYPPPSNQNSKDGYSGKCDYCGIEIIFSDPLQIKIVIRDSREDGHRFSIYHDGCYDRYLRRTID